MSVKKDIIVVAIKFFPLSSKEVSESYWGKIIDVFKECLLSTGHIEKSAEVSLLVRFDKLSNAYASIFGCIKKIKKEHEWDSEKHKLPIRIIFNHQYEDFSEAIFSPYSNLWDLLEDEVLYVTPSLKTNWHGLLNNIKLPTHLFEETDSALFKVRFSVKSKLLEELNFPPRELPVRGTMMMCFYCGMKTHTPSNCPSKQLAPDLLGIKDVGYLGISEICKCYKEVFSSVKKYSDIVERGVSYADIRKTPPLLVFVAFFDMLKVYQPRFLWNLATSSSLNWESSFKAFELTKDNRNLAMGFDCLRVGKFNQAQKMFEKELSKPFGEYYYASIAQSFVALETGDLTNMNYYLSKASTLANSEKEKVYVALLFARLDIVKKDFDSAQKTLSTLLCSTPKCFEAQYFQIQLDANHGATEETFKQLKELIYQNSAYFIMVLLDPMLIPIQGFVNEMLADIMQEKGAAAQQELRKILKAQEDLMVWANKSDKELQENIESTKEMKRKFENNSYFDYLDIEEKCNGLKYWFKKIHNKQIQKMEKDINRLQNRYSKYHSFWKNFKYQSFFGQFKSQITEVHKNLNRVGSLINSTDGAVLREVHDLLSVLEKQFSKLEDRFKQMTLMETAARGCISFGINLLILEVVFIGSGLVVSAVSSGADSSSLLSGENMSRIITIAAIAVAPMLALFTTFVRMKK